MGKLFQVDGEQVERIVYPLVLESRSFTAVKVFFFLGTAFMLVGGLGLLARVATHGQAKEKARRYLDSGR